jgi:hypothetical protein
MKIIRPGVAVREAPQDLRRRRLARLTCAAIVAGWSLTAIVAAVAGTQAGANAWLLAAIGTVTGVTWATRRWTDLRDSALHVLVVAASLQASAAAIAFDRGVVAAAGFALMVAVLAGLVGRTAPQVLGQAALIVAGQLLAAGVGPDRAPHALEAAIAVSIGVLAVAGAGAAVRVALERGATRRRRASDAHVLRDRLSEALAADPERFALLTLDLAGVEPERVEDVRAALAGLLRGDDLIARDADDGVCVLARTDGPGAEALAGRLAAAVAAYQHEDIGTLNAAIGIALYPRDGRTPDELVARADGALAARRAADRRLRAPAPALG